MDIADEAQRKTNPKRRMIWIMTLLSIVAPFVLSAFFIWCEISRGNFPNGWRALGGSCALNGEIWCTAQEIHGYPWAAKTEYRLQRINCATGTVTDALLQPAPGYCNAVVIGGSLFVNSNWAVYEVRERRLVPVDSLNGFNCGLFEYKGRATVAVLANDGTAQLIQWDGKKWGPAGKIILPSADRVFRIDAERDRVTLVPLPCEGSRQSDSGSRNAFILQVCKEGSNYHLLLRTNDQKFSAYRLGFEFLDDAAGGFASALAPENAPPDVSGWEPVFPPKAEGHWFGLGCDSNGALVSSIRDGIRIVRRRNDGSWSELVNQDSEAQIGFWYSDLVFDPTTHEAYLFRWEYEWLEGKIQKIEGDVIHPPHARIPGFKQEFLRRWCLLVAEVLSVWLLHINILSFGLWWRHSRVRPEISCGTHNAVLAPLWRRAAAFLVDGLIVYCLIAITWNLWRFVFRTESHWAFISFDRMVSCLVRTEHSLFCNYWSPKAVHDFLFFSPFGWPFLPLDPSTDFLGVLVVLNIAYWGTCIFMEGSMGITPGKWLMRIRTVRTTLQPCGFGRSLIRKLFLWIDLPFLFTPLPAAASLMQSDQRQRLGDRIADTVVIESKSFR